MIRPGMAGDHRGSTDRNCKRFEMIDTMIRAGHKIPVNHEAGGTYGTHVCHD